MKSTQFKKKQVQLNRKNTFCLVLHLHRSEYHLSLSQVHVDVRSKSTTELGVLKVIVEIAICKCDQFPLDRDIFHPLIFYKRKQTAPTNKKIKN
jgi:hypothetical protein